MLKDTVNIFPCWVPLIWEKFYKDVLFYLKIHLFYGSYGTLKSLLVFLKLRIQSNYAT